MVPAKSENTLKRNLKSAYRGRFSPIGLDIGSARIKLVQLTQSGGVPAVYRHAVIPAPAGGLQDAKNGFTAALSETLKEMIKQAGCHHNRVQLSLQSQTATLRRITLPLMSPQEIARTMRWEAEKHLPLSPEEAVFDYAFLDSRIAGGNTVLDFLLAAVPKAVAEDCFEAAAKAGLYPEAIEIAPLALRRAIEWCAAIHPHPYRGTLLVVHTGAESSDLMVLHQARYRFFRPINLGVNHLEQDAAAFSRLSPAESRRLSRSDEPLSEHLSGTVVKLARQITRSLEFYAYETEYPEKQCRAALLCGGGAMIPGLDTFLSNELGLETIRFDPLAPPYFKSGDGYSGAEEKAGPLFATALGLALRGWAR